MKALLDFEFKERKKPIFNKKKCNKNFPTECKSISQSNGELITRDEFLSDRKNSATTLDDKNSSKKSKHLCKSNGVRRMDSDRFNALIVQHTV